MSHLVIPLSALLSPSPKAATRSAGLDEGIEEARRELDLLSLSVDLAPRRPGRGESDDASRREMDLLSLTSESWTDAEPPDELAWLSMTIRPR